MNDPAIGQTLVEEEALARRVRELGEEISRDYEGRDVLIVEDIVDSGLTLSYLLRTLRARNPASLEVCALLTKPERLKVRDLPIRYKGFDIPNEFAIGYGLDHDQRYRNLPYVAALADRS